MDAIVLAGGYATRLWPITKDRPKMFLPLGERTVIDRILGDLEHDDRIDEVYVSTNERFAPTFESYLRDAAFDKPALSVEDTAAEDEKFGVVGALAQLVDREGLHDDTIVVAGDNLFSFDLAEFVDFFREHGTPTLAAYDVGSREQAKQFGLVDLDGERVVDFQEKPDDPKSTLVSIACYGLPAGTLDELDTYLANDNNPDEPGWFIQWLQARRAVHAFTFDGVWFDIGTPENYLAAVEWLLDGEQYVHPDATVENATIGENVQLLAGAEVRDATIERSTVFPHTTIRGCTVRESIIDERAELESVDLTGAVVSAHTQLTEPRDAAQPGD